MGPASPRRRRTGHSASATRTRSSSSPTSHSPRRVTAAEAPVSGTRSWSTSTRRRCEVTTAGVRTSTAGSRSRARRRAGCAATRASSRWSSATAGRSRSDGRPARSRRRSGARCGAGTAGASSRAARNTGGSMHTTSNIGCTVVRPSSATSSSSVATTTGSCTRAASSSRVAPAGTCGSGRPTAGSFVAPRDRRVEATPGACRPRTGAAGSRSLRRRACRDGQESGWTSGLRSRRCSAALLRRHGAAHLLDARRCDFSRYSTPRSRDARTYPTWRRWADPRLTSVTFAAVMAAS